MEKGIRDFQPNESIQVHNKKYYFLERESRPGKIHIQEGGQANVVKLKDEYGKAYALKVFKARYRKDAILERGNYLKKYANLPGLQAANNEIVSPVSVEYQQTLENYPFLQYAILMPWLPEKKGTTWSALRSKQSSTRYPLPSKDNSHKRAMQLAKALSSLSSKSIAHCDLCPKNLVIDEDDNVYLIDLENYYHHSFPPPPWGCPAGQDGYKHKSIDSLQNKQYNSFADAFAGALLISEMLTWHDPVVRNNSLDEMLFPQSDIQTKSSSYRVVKQSLREISKDCETLFEAAWFSEKLDDCPSISKWVDALENTPPITSAEIPTGATNIHAVSRRKVERLTTSSMRSVAKEIPTQPVSTISPHVNRRVSASQMQNQMHKQMVRQPAKPVSQQSSQKPIIQTTNNTQSGSVGGLLAGLSAGTVFIIMMICVILVFVWLAYQ